MNVCTIIAKNYLAHARVLGRSFARVHPEGRLWTLVIDDFENYLDPAQEPFEVLTPAQVGCDRFLEMALRYSILELSTAVKPWLMRHLLAETGQPVTYLDPDIKVYGSLRHLDELGDAHGLVLTPHNSRPVPADGRRPSQIDIMIAGVYNLGYVTLGPGPETEELLDWWADRLLRDCRVDPVWGYFVDQRWFDLAPGLVSDLAIVRDPEYNIAYWNLHSRRLEHGEGGYTVDGRPLAFFHFSGFDPETPLVLSRHQDRIDVSGNPALERILTEYAADVMGEGHAVSRRWPYTYATLADGTSLDPTLRSLFDAYSDERRAAGAILASPFSMEGIGSFEAWLRSQEPGAFPGVSRALAHVYRKRDDLRAAYPDLTGAHGAGLLAWATAYGRSEVPLLRRVMNGEAETSSSRGAGPAGPSPSDPPPARQAPPPAEHQLADHPWGVNVIGHLGASTPSGRTARTLLARLDAAGVPAAPILSATGDLAAEDALLATAAPEDAPYAVNLICLDGDVLPELTREAGGQLFAGRYSIAVWELDDAGPPPSWEPALSLLEEIWVPEPEVADALEGQLPVSVQAIPIEADPDAAARLIDRRLQLIRATGRARRPADTGAEMPRAIAELPLRVNQAPGAAAPGSLQRVRQLARRGVLRLMRPVTVRQHAINQHLTIALQELHRSIVELRREDAVKRANLLTQLRGYERLAALADGQASGLDTVKHFLMLRTDRSVYLALAELERRSVAADRGEAPHDLGLTRHELRVFSQNGEDGVLAEILRRVGTPSRYFVEFGVESGHEGNCVLLADVAGWRGLFMDGDERFFGELQGKYRASEAVATVRALVTPASVEELFAQAGVPQEPDVLSIDVDGQDYWIWAAIEQYRPRVVIVEYNSALDPRQRLVQPQTAEGSWDGSDYFGASLGALESLAESKGYRLVHTELSGVNAFFVRSDLVGAAFPPPEEVVRRAFPNYFQTGHRHPPARSPGPYLDLDRGVEVYLESPE